METKIQLMNDWSTCLDIGIPVDVFIAVATMGTVRNMGIPSMMEPQNRIQGSLQILKIKLTL